MRAMTRLSGVVENLGRIVVQWSHFFFNDPATTEIYTLSLHDALPISGNDQHDDIGHLRAAGAHHREGFVAGDRKSTRLNSSHVEISYAVLCVKKKMRASWLPLVRPWERTGEARHPGCLLS